MDNERLKAIKDSAAKADRILSIIRTLKQYRHELSKPALQWRYSTSTYSVSSLDDHITEKDDEISICKELTDTAVRVIDQLIAKREAEFQNLPG